ncbi:hypothetical protein D3C71_228210 [compost metagenome]
MATPAQLAAKLGTLLTAIKTKLNGKLDATARAADSSKLEGLTLAQVQAKTVSDNLGQVNGRRGESAFFSQEGTPGALVGAEMLNSIRMASDDAAITALKSGTVSFSEIFTKWSRISHGTNGLFPSLPAELDGWSYDSATDSIASTINSVSMIGIISSDRFDSYEFETIMKSTSNDDDMIGMCLAFKKVGDKEHSLTVMVSSGGMNALGAVANGQTPKLAVIVNAGQTGAQGQQVLTVKELGVPAQTFLGADFAPGIRVVAKRSITGLIEITCTRADGSPWPNAVSWSGNLPAVFQSKCAIGYVSVSQPAASWQNVKLPTSQRDIVDTRDLTVWRFTNNAWVNAGKANNPDVMIPGRLYKNTEGNMGSYYLDFEGNFVTLGLSATP